MGGRACKTKAGKGQWPCTSPSRENSRPGAGEVLLQLEQQFALGDWFVAVTALCQHTAEGMGKQGAPGQPGAEN